MADKLKTTSSISSHTTKASPVKPNSREAELMTKLAEHISDNYRMVKNRQQKFYDLTNQMKMQEENSAAGRLRGKCMPDEWQEVYSPKNKLKRKKTLSSSLTSVTDSVNQEKRTRIEGIHLNCRGKLNIKENQNAAGDHSQGPPVSHSTPRSSNTGAKHEKLAAKPPLPPHNTNKANASEPNGSKVVAAVPPPPRLKRKLQENVQTIKKLNALAEQLRLEINELKSNLTTERGAVRVLRAQNEAETRKWKTEVKKLQNVVEHLKKNGTNKRGEQNSASNAENLPQTATAVGGLVNYEIQRLTNEVNALKEANKALEEKKVINCDADRRKAADIRELKDSYEIRLTQIQKSAKIEISRLLEEIKTKERSIGQLKKDLQTLQNSKSSSTTSRNATTNNQTNSTNKTTTPNLNKKPKNSNNNNSNNNNATNNNNTTITTTTYKNNQNQTSVPASTCGIDDGKAKPQSAKNQDQQQQKPKSPKCGDDDSAKVENEEESSNSQIQDETENSNEISKLKNIELINNTKNVTTNLQRSPKILTTRNNDNANDERERNLSASLKSIHQQLKALDIPEVHNDCMNLINENGQFATLLTTTKAPSNHNNDSTATRISSSSEANDTDRLLITASSNRVNNANEKMTPPASTPAVVSNDVSDNMEEHHLSQELTQHLNTKAMEEAKQTDLHNHSHSDSDSALSSAPPSISPQPPASGVEPTDIWQTIRSYSSDIEKLQKEVDSLQKENEKLRQELNVAKDQIIDLESAALEHNANNEKHQQLLERIRSLEETENDLREQNELLEFRILELEDNSSDKWSLQTNPASEVPQGNQNVWSCSAERSPPKPDPFEMLFGSNSHTSTTNSVQLDSGIISPQSQGHHDDLIDITNEELCRRLGDLLKKTTLEEDEKHCLQQVLNLVQQLDALTPRSGPNSLLANTSSEEASSMDMVKSRISEYSSTSSSPLSSLRSNGEKTPKSVTTTGAATTRIVATVQPYNSSASYSHGPSSAQTVPHNTPTDSPRKTRSQHWHNNSLSESGVFVESDFLSDSGDNSVCTQTDFEDCSSASNNSHHPQSTPTKHVPAHITSQNQHPHQLHHPSSSSLSDQKRLQYYQDRVALLEGKVLIYESSGDVQAKHLAERLQREILLEKEVKELRERVEFLESENCTLEEEKCEFEEAENDTRLRLQRLEIELEILSQRNVELEMSREALSAKYKDCHSECLILRDDLATSETNIRHLEEDKQKAKENFEFLHSLLPVLLVCNTAACTIPQEQRATYGKSDMGTSTSALNLAVPQSPIKAQVADPLVCNSEICKGHEREVQYLKEEVKCLRHQIKELNSRHYAAMESADSHWVDIEREYKEREEQFHAKEMSLKQKIQKLQDCLKEDARSANEKICQLEEAEQGLKSCLVKVSKEHQKLLEDHQCLVSEFERFKEQHDQLREQQKPLTETLEMEKKRNKGLVDELTFMRKLQQETELQTKSELDSIRNEMFDLRKEYLHIEVTNGELREEVATLELQVETLHKTHRDCEEKVRCLTDEIRTKDEICQKLEKRLERSEGYSLADELGGDTPTKRFKREDVKDLKTASKGLGNALRHMSECEKMLPTQKQFQTVARDVKKLADTLLHGETSDEEVSIGENSEEERIENQVTQETDSHCGISNKNGGSTLSLAKQSKENLEPPKVEKLVNNSKDKLEEVNLTEENLVNNSTDKLEEVHLTVGMAMVPEFHITDTIHPAHVDEQKKAICEVPSELRKLSKQPKQDNVNLQNAYSLSNYRKRRAKRLRGLRLVKSLQKKAKHFVSKNHPPLIHNISNVGIRESEILQRSVSYGSFHSLLEENTDISHESFVDVSTESKIEKEVMDMETETVVEKKHDRCIQVNEDKKSIYTIADRSDISVQVNEEEIQTTSQMNDIPPHIICFLNLLNSTIPKAEFPNSFNWKFYQLWHTDCEFRDNLQLLVEFTSFRDENFDFQNISLHSYDSFVNAMNCLHILQDLFKPHMNPILLQIEEQVNEHLMHFYTKEKESQFYCTVYYPVKRSNHVIMS